MKPGRRCPDDLAELQQLLREAASLIPSSTTPPPAPMVVDRKKATALERELERQRDRDKAAGRLVDLGNGGAWRRRCRPAQ